MSISPAPASTGLKYSDITTMASFATGSVTVASLEGFLDPHTAAAIGGISGLITLILIPITAFLRSKGD